MKHPHTKGLVLINALLVVAALSAVAALLLRTAQGARLRQSHMSELAQTQSYLDGAEALLRRGLDLDRAQNDVDHLGEAWAQKEYTALIDRGQIVSTMRDLSGLFNLNWLAGRDPVLGPEAFFALLQELGLKESLGQDIIEWLSEEGPQNRIPYSARQPGLAPRGGAIEIFEELLLLEGMTPAIFARLETVLTAVPTDGVININTAPRAVLQAVMPDVSASVIGALIDQRRKQPFPDDDAVSAYLGKVLSEAEKDKVAGVFTTTSQWFKADISAQLGAGLQRRQVVFHRTGEAQKKTQTAYRITGNQGQPPAVGKNPP